MNLSSHEKELAIKLASALDDMKSLLTFERMVQRNSESFLMEMLKTVLKTPKEKIRNSRGAYFTFLVNQRTRSKKFYQDNNDCSPDQDEEIWADEDNSDECYDRN